MAYDLADLVHAAEARLMHGERAGQYLVDVMQRALREGDEESAFKADRAMRVLVRAGDWRGKYRVSGVSV